MTLSLEPPTSVRQEPNLLDMLGPRPAAAPTLGRQAWFKLLLLGGLVVALQFSQLHLLALSWWTLPDWNHGFIIPLFSLYLLYSRWQDMVAAPRRICLPGLLLLVVSLVGEAWGVLLLRNHMVSQVFMVPSPFSLLIAV